MTGPLAEWLLSHVENSYFGGHRFFCFSSHRKINCSENISFWRTQFMALKLGLNKLFGFLGPSMFSSE